MTGRPDEVIARLDSRTGKRVLCGRRNTSGDLTCSGWLARVHEVETLAGPARIGTPLEGWTPKEPSERERGVGDWWTPTRYSEQRAEEVRRLVRAGAIPEDREAKGTLAKWRTLNRGVDVNISARDLPRHFKCPKCGRWNILDAKMLEIDWQGA
jgi:hypothetical protein